MTTVLVRTDRNTGEHRAFVTAATIDAEILEIAKPLSILRDRNSTVNKLQARLRHGETLATYDAYYHMEEQNVD